MYVGDGERRDPSSGRDPILPCLKAFQHVNILLYDLNYLVISLALTLCLCQTIHTCCIGM